MIFILHSVFKLDLKIALPLGILGDALILAWIATGGL
jgi:hypothetical protein